MNATHLHCSFRIDKARTLDTMEAVLAIARRGGLNLSTLQLRSRPDADHAWLELHAEEPALLELFLTRLHNVIGIDAIDVPELSHMHVA